MQQLLTILVPYHSAQNPEKGAQQPVEPDRGTTAPGGTTSAVPGHPGNAGAPQPPCGGDLVWLMPLFVMLMYVMAIKPERKRRKEMEKMMAELKAGDTVVTTGGVHGVVHQVQDKTLVLRVDTIKIIIDKAAVARVLRGDEAAPK
ncbi:MAG: hypothetical protein Fur0037_27180 [Planctomycetota bacterium]